MVLVQTQILKILDTGKGNILIVAKQLENFSTVRSYIHCTSTSRAIFFLKGMRIQHIQIDHGNMIRGHNELKTYVIKN